MQQRIINNRTITFLCLINFCFLILSCNKSEDGKKYHQLRKAVLAHYKADSNPLKEKAAQFLLDNLMNRYSVEGDRYEKYVTIIKERNPNRDTVHTKLLSVRNLQLEDKIVMDVSVLTPEYLIDNIDRAFKAWYKAGWKDQVSFENFCEYILPYRIGNEPIENWRKEILQDTIFKITGDTVFSSTDIETAAAWLTKRFSKLKNPFDIKWGADAANIPDMPYSTLKFLTSGTCTNVSQISLFTYRSAGIPIANDFTPHWANNASGHDWTAIITKTSSIPFNIIGCDTLRLYKSPDYIPSKVFRHTFSENEESHAKQRGYCKFLPGFFNDSRIRDITELYEKTSSISIPIAINPNREKYAYLAVSDRDNWVPVAWARVKDGKANFDKIVRPAVYMPVLVSDAEIQFLNNPILLAETGDVSYLNPDHKNLQKVALTRKYPLRSTIVLFTNRMKKGQFQAANNIDFKNAVTLHAITEDPGVYYQQIPINDAGKYRYVRYAGARNSQCNVAEIEFYSKNEVLPLKGKVIGTPGTKPLENAFDGNDLTYMNTYQEEGAWVGLDLGKPTEISKIRFVSRNDKNHIVIGNEYELFYWDNEWKSLGQQVATDKVLIFDQSPSNCLFLLKNYTEGKEERIFTYENGKQVWW